VNDALNRVGPMRPLRNVLSAEDIAGLQQFFVAVNLRPVALRPRTGIYWNPFEGGRGFALESSGDVLAFIAYYYANNGRATWSIAAGSLSTSQMLTALSTQRGGQTLAGPYVAPVSTPSPGPIETIVTSDNSLVLNWPGGWVLLERASLSPTGLLLAPRSGAPETGIWWASEEGGRGYALEIQDDRVFLSGYMYDASGEPIWYTAQGALDAGNARFESRWLQFAGGQTLTGPWQPNQLLNENVGPVVIEFDSPRSGILVLPDGRRQRIVRFFP
jgi:hypothetical protein